MKIKQQKAIKIFLINEYGGEKGGALFSAQDKMLCELIENTSGKTKNQMKTLSQTVLPRVALYKSLQSCGLSQQEAYDRTGKYMADIVGAQKHASMVKMEAVPGFFSIYRSVFIKIMRTTDLQKSTQATGNGFFDITITKCLWHTACVENGCAELCRLFCDVDDITYGNLKKMGFSRTQTLGYGGDCCDFHMFKK